MRDRKYLIALCLFLSVGSCSVSRCNTDTDCNNGFCVDPSISPYSFFPSGLSKCSCFSGHGGSACEIPPSANCSSQISPVTDSAAFSIENLNLSIDSAAQLKLSIALPFSWYDGDGLNDTLWTLILFSNGTVCDFPFSDGFGEWRVLNVDQSESCHQVYEYIVPVRVAIESCGFVRSDLPDSIYYDAALTALRKFQLFVVDGIPLSRIEQSTRKIRIIFPKKLNVSVSNTDISVNGIPFAIDAIVRVDFDEQNDTWICEIKTAIQSPYLLKSPRASDPTQRVQANPSIGNCMSLDSCYQDTIVLIRACAALETNVTLRYEVACSNDSGCPIDVAMPPSVTVFFGLKTAAACARAALVVDLSGTLNSFSSRDFNLSRDRFTIGTTAYFQAAVVSSKVAVLEIEIAGAFDQQTGIYLGSTTLPCPGNSGILQSCFSVQLNTYPFIGANLTRFGIVAKFLVTYQNLRKEISGIELFKTIVVENKHLNDIEVLALNTDGICVEKCALVCLMLGAVGLAVVGLWFWVLKKKDWEP